MDPVRNPFAPGAGQRPPELAGAGPRGRRVRDRPRARGARAPRAQPRADRAARRRQDGAARRAPVDGVHAGWGAGKVEARPDADLRRPLSAALHRAIRDLALRHRAPDRVDEVLGVLKAFALRSAPEGAKLRDRWQPGIDVPGQERPGRLRRHRDRPGRAVHRGRRARRGRRHRRRAAHRRDAGPPPRRRLRAVRRLPRAVPVPGAARGRRRRAAAPARGAVGVQVVLRAAVRLLADRSSRPRGRRLRAARPGRAGGRHVRRARPSTPSTSAPAATRTSSRPTARPPGTRRRAARSAPADVADGSARGRGRTGRRVLRLPLRAGHPRRAGVPARDGRADRRAATNRSSPPGSPSTCRARPPRCRRPGTAC